MTNDVAHQGTSHHEYLKTMEVPRSVTKTMETLVETDIIAAEVISGTATFKNGIKVVPKGNFTSNTKQVRINKGAGEVDGVHELKILVTHLEDPRKFNTLSRPKTMAHGFFDINRTGNAYNCGDCAIYMDILLAEGKDAAKVGAGVGPRSSGLSMTYIAQTWGRLNGTKLPPAEAGGLGSASYGLKSLRSRR